jgi:hypothetical protein
MNTLKQLIIATSVLAALAGPGAAKAVSDQIGNDVDQATPYTTAGDEFKDAVPHRPGADDYKDALPHRPGADEFKEALPQADRSARLNCKLVKARSTVPPAPAG